MTFELATDNLAQFVGRGIAWVWRVLRTRVKFDIEFSERILRLLRFDGHQLRWKNW